MSHLTSFTINEVWDRNILNFNDVVGGSQVDFDLFREGASHQKDIIEIIQNHTHLRAKHDRFFDNNDYDWCFDEKSYRLNAEASFQFRLLYLLIKIYEDASTNKLLEKKEPIVVRQAIVSRSRLQPKTVFAEEINFIIIPLGWIEFEYFAGFGVEQLIQNQYERFRLSFLGWCSKIFADEAIDKYQSENDDWSPEPILYTLLSLEISKALIDKYPLFCTANSDITNIDGVCEIIAYACEAFVLAHETAHIFFNEQKKKAFEAHEQAADELAFSILTLTKEVLIKSDIGITDVGLPVLAAESFIFIGNAALQTIVGLEVDNPVQSREFRERSFLIQEKANNINLDQDDKKKINYLIIFMRSYLEATQQITNELLSKKEEIIDLGYDKIIKIMAAQ